MKKEVKDKLDKEVLKSKVKFYVIFGIPLLVIVLLFVALFPISNTNIEVTATKITAEQTDFGNIPIMWAALDDGTNIKVSMPSNVETLNGKRVEVIKTNTLIGVSTYKFVRYVN